MKSKVSVLAVCSAFLLFGLTSPGHAAEITFNDTTNTGGDITTDNTQIGATDPVTGLTNVPFDELVVSGDTADPTANGTYTGFFWGGGTEGENLSGDTLTLSGEFTGCAPSAACSTVFGTTGPLFSNSPAPVLATIVFNTTPALTADTSSSHLLGVNTPPAADITSITLSPTLLADLGLTGTTFSLNALNDVGSAIESGNYDVVNNATLDFISGGAPEPASGLMAALALALIVFISRRRFRGAGHFGAGSPRST